MAGFGSLAHGVESQLHKENSKITNKICVNGYKVHSGINQGSALKNLAIHLTHHSDGAISEDKKLMQTYLHRLFESTDVCVEILKWAGFSCTQRVDYGSLQEATIERLADNLEQHLNLQDILHSLKLKS